VSEVTLTVRGLDEALKRLERKAKSLRKGAQAALHEGAERIVDHARDLAPARTATLRNSIGILDEGDLSVTFGSKLDYARFVEYGTSRTAAQPYLRPAVLWGRETIRKALQRLATME